MALTRDPILVLGPLVRAAAVAALGPSFADVAPAVRRSDRADYQADLAMGLARKVGKPPRAIAEQIAAHLPLGEVIEKVEIAGPGFINLTLTSAWLDEAVNAVSADPRLGVCEAEKKERVSIDYSSPNVAKEMHVGHLRSTVIGDALARVLEWRGHTVIRVNHLGDWGTPFGLLIEHLLDQGEKEAERELALGELVAFYKTARKKFDEDPAFADRSRKRVVLLQGGDADTLKWWNMLVELSARYFRTVYDLLGVTLKDSDVRGESFYNSRLVPLAEELEKRGYAKVHDGALCVFPEGFTNKEGEPLPLIVRKSDSGFGYATTDLAAIRFRVDELHATRILYVVGAPQSQHFAMLIAAAKSFGWIPGGVRVEHVAFGSVLGTDKKMFKSRAGDTVRLIDLIEAAIDRALTVTREKAKDLDEATLANVAKTVGVGAIKYADLSSDRVKDYVFDLDRMVSFTGNSAGYSQYAYARIQSIFRRVGTEASAGRIQLVAPEERALGLAILGFAEAVETVEEALQPHQLAGYVYALSTAFAAFYDACPILKDVSPEVRASRLGLADLTARTIARALDLLGISVPERM